MRKLYAFISLLLAATSGAGGFTASAVVDSEGYPILYIRGDQTGNAWAVNEDYLLTRTGSTYSIHLDALNGGFKSETTSGLPNTTSRTRSQARHIHRLRL